MQFDYLIVGNGSIGSLSAIQLAESHPKTKIGIIGPVSRNNGASAAAGAMVNVFAEYEFSYSKKSFEAQAKYLKLGIDGSTMWLDFLAKFNITSEIITCNDTLVFLKKDAADFEVRNYLAMQGMAADFRKLEIVDPNLLAQELPHMRQTLESVSKLKGEFALDTESLLTNLDKILTDLGVVRIDDSVHQLILGPNITVITKTETFHTTNLVIAAGAVTDKLLDSHYMIPMLQGVGTAILLNSPANLLPKVLSSFVLRTVNRGGAQCGLHFLPRKKGYYLGAGNYITFPGESQHRLETVRYLFDTFESEVIGKEVSYDLVGDLVKGHRPRTLDSYPAIGALSENPNCFIATGTNRAGLTWAPVIANEIITWSRRETPSDLFSDWIPDRKPISYGNEDDALEYFVQSRLGAALEHSLIGNNHLEISRKKEELLNHGKDLMQLAKLRFSGIHDFVPHPDHWASINNSTFTCFT